MFARRLSGRIIAVIAHEKSNAFRHRIHSGVVRRLITDVQDRGASTPWGKTSIWRVFYTFTGPTAPFSQRDAYPAGPCRSMDFSKNTLHHALDACVDADCFIGDLDLIARQPDQTFDISRGPITDDGKTNDIPCAQAGSEQTFCLSPSNHAADILASILCRKRGHHHAGAGRVRIAISHFVPRTGNHESNSVSFHRP